MQPDSCFASGIFFLLHSILSVAASPLACPDVPAIANGSYFVLRDNSTREGPIVRYTCDEGFVMAGSQDVTCVWNNGSAHWQPDPPLCREVRDCPELKPPKHGFIEGDDCCAPGDVLEFYCEDEYELEGAKSLTCQLTGVWSDREPTCRSIYCPDPGVSEKGEKVAILSGEFYEGRCCPPETKMVFECEEGYELIGQKISTCGNRSRWTSPRPLCKPEIACEDFEVDHGTVSGTKSGGDYYGLGDDVFVTCDEGYRVEGSSDLLFCEEEGLWDSKPPQCVAYNCTRRDFGPHVVVAEFRDTNATSFPVGTTVYFECEDGYVLDGPSSTTCKGGHWFGRPPKCHLIQCGSLTAPANGWITGSSTAVGSTVSFRCFQGYHRLGPEERQCFSDGQWSGDVVRCVAEASLRNTRTCLDPGVPDNGVKMGSCYEVGSSVSFACNPGFHLRGERSIRCTGNGTWSAPLPLCTGRFYFDKPWTIDRNLRDHLTEVAEESAALNMNDERLERTINLNERGVRHIVYFVFDASASIGLKNLRTGVGLAKAITRKVNVTLNGHRVGAIRFNNTANLVLNPLDVTSTDDALRGLDRVAAESTAGGTAIKEAIRTLRMNAELLAGHLVEAKNKISVFFITDGKANLGGSPSKEVSLFEKKFKAKIYCIGLTGSPDRKALEELASKPSAEYVFILRNYAVMEWLADHLTNGTTDYSVCGRSSKHMPDTGLEVEDDGVRARIFGGQKVVESWPWMVEIRIADKELQFACGASIISSRWLLSAAHCFGAVEKQGYRERSREEFKLRLGLTNRKNTTQAQEVFIEEIIRHEDFNPDTLQNDIALLRLNQTISFNEFARPICLPPSHDRLSQRQRFYMPNETAFVIGWGGLKAKGTPVAELQQLKLHIQGQAICRKKYMKKTYDNSMMCAIGTADKKKGDACEGDSGGPLMQGVIDDDTVWTQVGIVSWGMRCSGGDKPGVYTNVSKFVPWIESVMNRAQNSSDVAQPPSNSTINIT